MERTNPTRRKSTKRVDNLKRKEDWVTASHISCLKKAVAVFSLPPGCSLAMATDSSSIWRNGLHISPSSSLILKRNLGPPSPNSIRSPSLSATSSTCSSLTKVPFPKSLSIYSHSLHSISAWRGAMVVSIVGSKRRVLEGSVPTTTLSLSSTSVLPLLLPLICTSTAFISCHAG